MSTLTITVAPGHGTADHITPTAPQRQAPAAQQLTFGGPFEVASKPKLSGMTSLSIATTVGSASNSPDQWYYWTPAWQREEARAVAELNSGQYMEFSDAESAIAWLLGPDE